MPDTLTLRPGRAGIVASLLAGVAFAGAGVAMIVSGNATGWIVVAIGAVGLLAFVAGVRPGVAHLRLDPQGFFVRAPTKSWGAAWLEVERFRVDQVLVGRTPSPMDVVRVDYRDGFEAQHAARHRLGRTLGIDEHYVMPGYDGRSAADLVALLEDWRQRYG